MNRSRIIDMTDLIDIHADDYALTVHTSEDILALMKDGVLDSISIVPNNSCYSECMDMLKSSIPDLPFLPKMSVHLNLVEGLSLSSNYGSYITSTWKSLFIDSYNPFGRSAAKARIKSEIKLQIQKVQNAIKDCIRIAKENNIPRNQIGLRIDSHQHTHMIPIVWEALTESLAENGYEAEYIRNSKEPLLPFISKPSLWTNYRPVNIIKNRILHVFSRRPDIYEKKTGHRPMYLWGLIMSGKMDSERIAVLYPRLVKKAKKEGRVLEILFHPGRMSEEEKNAEIPAEAAEAFYLNADRDTEKQGAIFCRELSSPAQSDPVQNLPR